MKKIAVIGGGIAGIYSAYKLQNDFDVTIFEASDYLGGHTNTVTIEDGLDAGVAVDTGFIVLNDRTYPDFSQFLEELQVGIRYSDMSFSVYNPQSGLQYCSRSLSTLFAQPANVFNLQFLRMLLEMKKFWKVGSEALQNNILQNLSLKEFLDKHRFSSSFRYDFLYPLSAAVWSSSERQLDSFPAITFLSFFRNHGWLTYSDQPRWQTVVGGSNSYVKRFTQKFTGEVKLNSAVKSLEKNPDGSFEILCTDGFCGKYHQVVVAVHADQVLKIIKNPSAEHQDIFGRWKYSDNLTLLHTDNSFMPPLGNAWGSWNYRKEVSDKGTEPVSVTYDMNRLQGLNTKHSYFVTLNPRKMPAAGKLIRSFNYTHPVYDEHSVESQNKLRKINGNSGLWFCGSYCGYGFHEDAVRAAKYVVEGIIKRAPGLKPGDK